MVIGIGVVQPIGGEDGIEDARADDQPELGDHHDHKSGQARLDECQSEGPAGT